VTESLTAALQRAKIQAWDEAEQRLAAELKLDVSAPVLSTDLLERWDRFAIWTASRGVRKCPARPATCAAYCLAQHEMGATAQAILAMLAAIEAIHDHHNLPNPVRTAIARAALGMIVKVDPPKSWPAADRVLFAQLDPAIRQIIADRERDRDRALRRLQNEAAESRKAATNGAANKARSEHKDDQQDEAHS
jgi:hypothetical protein